MLLWKSSASCGTQAISPTSRMSLQVPRWGEGSTYLALGEVTMRCLASSPATVEGVPPAPTRSTDSSCPGRVSSQSCCARACPASNSSTISPTVTCRPLPSYLYRPPISPVLAHSGTSRQIESRFLLRDSGGHVSVDSGGVSLNLLLKVVWNLVSEHIRHEDMLVSIRYNCTRRRSMSNPVVLAVVEVRNHLRA